MGKNKKAETDIKSAKKKSRKGKDVIATGKSQKNECQVQEPKFDFFRFDVSSSPHVNSVAVQRRAVSTIFQILGNDVFVYYPGSKRRCNKMQSILRAAKISAKVNVSDRTIKDWYQHAVMYGETIAESTKYKRIREYAGGREIFDTQETKALKDIVDSLPYLYLDEVATVLESKTGKKWSNSTIWKHLHGPEINYTLQKAVFRAKQISLIRIQEYKLSLLRMCSDPRQLCFFLINATLQEMPSCNSVVRYATSSKRVLHCFSFLIGAGTVLPVVP